MQKKVWVYKEIDEQQAVKLADEAGISRLLAKVFVSRGICDAAYVRDFLEPDIAGLHDPFLMDGMERAVGRILQAIDSDEEILVYGDYDVDGVTSASILYNFLGSAGARVQYFLPDRLEDGYGLTMSAIDKVKLLNASLIITVDCGITSVDEVRILQEAGMQVIVTDHHECKELLPEAYAVLNPHKPGCCYPFKELSGAGVALKLVQGICIRSGRDDEYLKYLDLAALSTIADVVPLLDENRIIASFGLRAMDSTQNQGLAALIRAAGLGGKPVTSFGAAFGLAPRVNAAGRLGSALRGVRLFTTGDRVTAEALAKELDTENRNRQDTENEILAEAIAFVEEKLDSVKQKVLVVAGEGWHHGVVGIVASKLADRYQRPCIVISIEEKSRTGEENPDESEGHIGKGSGRSIKGFNLFAALTLCEDILERYGGHEMAAGLTLKAEKIEEFRRRINEYADSVLTEADLLPCIKVDALLERGDISAESVRELAKMAPFGEANPNPNFGYLALSVADIKALSGGKHMKLRLTDAGMSVEAIGFNMGELTEKLAQGDVIDAVFVPEINVWNGNERLQLNLRDVKPCVYADIDKNIVFSKANDYNSYINLQEINRLLACSCLRPADLVPERSELEAVYRYIRSCSKTKAQRDQSLTNMQANQSGKQHPMQDTHWDQLEFRDLYDLSSVISERYSVRLNYFKLKRSLEIFVELGLLAVQPTDENTVVVRLLQGAEKVELETSRLYKQLRRLSDQGFQAGT